jgi:hypothetical protein
VIRVPTHRPQPSVFPLWPHSYGLSWMDMRRDRFGCKLVTIITKVAKNSYFLLSTALSRTGLRNVT